jgi:hypothetical protein
MVVGLSLCGAGCGSGNSTGNEDGGAVDLGIKPDAPKPKPDSAPRPDGVIKPDAGHKPDTGPKPDGGTPSKLIVAGNVGLVGISMDGETVAYASDIKQTIGTFALNTIPLAGGTSTKVVSRAFMAAWMASDTLAYFTDHFVSGEAKLWLWSAAAKAPVEVAASTLGLWARISRDGKYVAFLAPFAPYTGGCGLSYAGLDGVARPILTEITDSTPRTVYSPANDLLFVGYREEFTGPWTWCQVTLATGATKELGTNFGPVLDVSPDGKSAVYVKAYDPDNFAGELMIASLPDLGTPSPCFPFRELALRASSRNSSDGHLSPRKA